MQIPRPAAAGEQWLVGRLRSILFSEPILGATDTLPKGYLKGILLAGLLGWLGPLVARRATDPLPATHIYLAVTPVDVRLFSKPLAADAFEIGRWKRGTYRASVRGRNLDLELDRLGRIRLSGGSGEVFELVVEGAAGPAL